MRFRRPALTVSLLACALALAGCESFDPTDWFNTKKPLPGDRKEMFPGGVPGVPQGVPPELVDGYKPPPDQPPPQVVEQEKPKPKPKPKPRPRPKPAAAPQEAAPQAQPSGGASAPWPNAPAPSPGPAASPFPPPPTR